MDGIYKKMVFPAGERVIRQPEDQGTDFFHLMPKFHLSENIGPQTVSRGWSSSFYPDVSISAFISISPDIQGDWHASCFPDMKTLLRGEM